MDLDTTENRARLIQFGNLSNDKNFHVMSPETAGYNCIAWAMGFSDRWVDWIPDRKQHKKWWPEYVNRSYLPQDLVNAFKAVGFEECEDDSPEDGYDKVALYKVAPFYDPITKAYKPEGWTHAARILSKDTYHSKMGPSFDIYHSGGDIFQGTSYGNIFQYMKRPHAKGIQIVDSIIKNEPRLSVSNLQLEELLAIVRASGIKLP